MTLRNLDRGRVVALIRDGDVVRRRGTGDVYTPPDTLLFDVSGSGPSAMTVSASPIGPGQIGVTTRATVTSSPECIPPIEHVTLVVPVQPALGDTEAKIARLGGV